LEKREENKKIHTMKILSILLTTFWLLKAGAVYAQYTGGNGRGDVQLAVTGFSLPSASVISIASSSGTEIPCNGNIALTATVSLLTTPGYTYRTDSIVWFRNNVRVGAGQTIQASTSGSYSAVAYVYYTYYVSFICGSYCCSYSFWSGCSTCTRYCPTYYSGSLQYNSNVIVLSQRPTVAPIQPIASDSASNYSGVFSNASNGGSGLNAWAISSWPNTGVFIGNPANDGMGTTGIGTTAFGFYATGSNYLNARRSFQNALQTGDELSFYWSMNWDANGGNKGFDIKSGNTTVFNINNRINQFVTSTYDTALRQFGTVPMLVKLKRTGVDKYSFSMTGRVQGETYSTTITTPLPVDGIEFYIGSQFDWNGFRNIYVNHFQITSNATVVAYVPTLVSGRSATFNGKLMSLDICPVITEKGFVYSPTSINSSPEVGGNGVTKTVVPSVVTGAYSALYTDLSPKTGYSYRAYVYDGTSYTYSAVQSFATTDAANWDFGFVNPGVATSTFNSNPNISLSTLSAGNVNGTITIVSDATASSGYTGASGFYNAGHAARTGVLNTANDGSAYFEFTVSPPANTSFRLTGISFGSRSASTGPVTYVLRSSLNNYTTNIATGTMLANSTWALESNSGFNVVSAQNTPVTFRIYGYGGSGSPVANTMNWQIDDVLLNLSVISTETINAPVAISASSITNESFVANWNSVSGVANGYRLDVSTTPTFMDTSVNLINEGFNNSLTHFTRSGGSYYSGNSGTADVPASSPFFSEGTHGFGISNGTATLTSSAINLSNYVNTQLTFKLAAFGIGSSANGLDETSDQVRVDFSLDGGTTYLNVSRISGNANAYWSYNAGGTAIASYDASGFYTDFIPAGGGARTSDGYSTVNITNLPAISNLIVRITLTNNSTTERWVIDQLTVSGNLPKLVGGYDNVSVNETSKVVAGLTPNTSYYYRVRAVGQNVTSSNSNSITLNTCSAAPSVTPSIKYCRNQSAVALEASGSNLRWYSSASGGTGSLTAPVPNTSNAGTMSYWVSQTENGACESPRAKIDVEVNLCYTLSYNANGGTGSVSADTTYEAGSTVTVASNSGGGLVRNGYTLIGWNTLANRTGIFYPLGTGSFTIEANTILYARWIPTSENDAKIWITGNGNWSDPANWYPQGVPSQSDNIYIDAGAPVLNTSHTVGLDKRLIIADQASFTVAPDITLTINGSADFGSRPVTLKSTQAGTATIGPLSANGSNLTGDTHVTVERYIPAAQKWRGLAAPLSSAIAGNSIYNSWQNNGNVIEGQGVLLWSPTTLPGFSLNTNIGASQNIRKYVGGAGFEMLSSTTSSPLFSEGKPVPYLIFVTDSYKQGTNTGHMGTGSTATTLRATGSLFKGPYNSGTLTTGFHMIPNPYPASLNLNLATFNENIDSSIYIWDPLIAGFRGFGGYQTYNALTSVIAPGEGSYTDGWNEFIPSGAAFWVYSNGTGSVGLSEDAKTSVPLNVFGRRPSRTDNNPLVRINLKNSSGDRLLDGVAVVYHNMASQYIDKMDSRKFGLSAENIFIRHSNTNLAIDCRPPLYTSDTIHLGLHQLAKQSYTLQISAANLHVDDYLVPVLEDLYLNKEVILDLKSNNNIEFTVDNQPGSSGQRFRIVFRTDVTTSVNSLDEFHETGIYPNPVSKGASMHLSLTNKPAGVYRLIIYDISGVQLSQQTIAHKGGATAHMVKLDKTLAAGTYVAELTDPKGQAQHFKLTIQ
jgi:hypothetical protein